MGESRFPRGRRADAIVAAAAFALDLADLLIRAVGHVSAYRILVVAAGLTAVAATLMVRRRRPMVVLVIAVSADVLLGVGAGRWSESISTVSLVALYSAGRYLPVARGWVAGGCAVVAVQDERRRIARELYDVVAHHIGVMNALVGAARTTMTRAPDESREAMEAAERTAREAMFEMREMLAVLRSEDGADIDESATADGVTALVRRAGETGVLVTLEVSASHVHCRRRSIGPYTA